MRNTLVLVLLLLLPGLFLYGCGSAGSSNPVSTPGGGSQPTSSSSGFTLNLVDAANSSAKSLVGVTIAGTPPTATDVRVIIRQYNVIQVPTTVCQYDDNGDLVPGTCVIVNVPTNMLVYMDIQDVPYPTTGSSVQVGIPAGTYMLDVITSRLESGNHSILKYGQIPSLTVTPGGSASVTLKTVNDILQMTVADTITSKTTFNVTLNDVLPFAPNYKMTMIYYEALSTAPMDTTTVNSSTNSCTFTAPASFTAGTISLQGQFTLNQSFLNKNESPTIWTRLFPNAAYGEQVYSTLNPLISVTVPVN